MPGDASDEPTVLQSVLLLLAGITLHIAILAAAFDYRITLPFWGDNAHYALISDAILRGQWRCDADCTWAFWGLPFAMAGVALALHVSALTALVVISIVASIAACVLIHRLYGGWVACATVAVGLTWIELGARGGTEPLFMALVYGAFVLVRRDRPVPAAALAVLAASVRLVGVFAVAGVLVDAMRRPSWRARIGAASVAGLVALAYWLAVAAIAGNPIDTIRRYQEGGWSFVPIGVPFATLLAGLKVLALDAPGQAIRVFGWIAASALALVFLWTRPSALTRGEQIFASAYIAFFFCATYEGVALYFARFMAPVAPIVVYSLRSWIPRRPALFWALTLAGSAAGAIATGRFLTMYLPKP